MVSPAKPRATAGAIPAERSAGTSSSHSEGFVLHSYPYKETSLILETFTRTHGRMSIVAKGAKRASAASRYTLMPFQLLGFEWFGRAEMKTLKNAEHERIFPQAKGAALMAAFYVNELLLKLAAKEDPHETLFDAYVDAIHSLTSIASITKNGAASENASAREIEIALRTFELAMLAELGYALTLTHEAERGDEIEPECDYWYVVDRGPIIAQAQAMNGNDAPSAPHALDPVRVSGKTLIAMSEGAFADPLVISQAKQLMRRVINHHLGDKALHTRQLVRELK
jgi:DNA repair protein RecO (recombination protein O)